MANYTDSPYWQFQARVHGAERLDISRLALPVWQARLKLHEAVPPGLLYRLVRGLERSCPRLCSPDTLLCGGPYEPYELTRMVQELERPADFLQSAWQLGRERGLDWLMLPNVQEKSLRGTPWLQHVPHVVLPSFASTELTVAGVSDFVQYLTRLPAAERNSIRRNIKYFERAGLRIVRGPLRAEQQAAYFTAYKQMLEHAKVHWYPYCEDYFAELVQYKNDVECWTVLDEHDAVVGFAVVFCEGGVWHAGRVGVHPQWYRRGSVFFRLFYAMIEGAIAAQADTLVLGPTAYRFKRHLGAQLRPLVNVVYPLSLPWRLLLRVAAPLARYALRHLQSATQLERYY